MLREFHCALLMTIVFVASLPADQLLIPESNSDVVYLASGEDGSVLNSNFLDIGSQLGDFGLTSSTPVEALEVGQEIWVSDQVADRIWRFGRSGSFLGQFGSDFLNNIRGMEVVGNNLYVAQGSDSATVNEGITVIDIATQSFVSSFGRAGEDISYQDVAFVNGELLVTNSDTGNDGIERFDLDGNFLGFFAQSDGVDGLDFGQQINVRGSNGNILVGGFSPPSGVYEFMADGTALGITAGLDFGPRAGFELGNGSVLWTNGNFLRTDDNIIVEGVSFRYISRTSVIPEPTAGLAVALAMMIAVGRRRK